jgi:hypothetical protein
MTTLQRDLPCFQAEPPVSESYLTASVETGSQVSAALPTKTTNTIKTKIQKLKGSEPVTFKYEHKKLYIYLLISVYL